MNEEEKESIEEFRKQLRLAINIDDVTTAIRNDNAQTILNLIEKLQKENEELKILKSGIQTLQNLGIEDGKYIVMSKTDFLNGSCKHLLDDYIPVQKVKDKIRKNEEIIDISNDGDLIHELLQKNKVYEELLESEE